MNPLIVIVGETASGKSSIAMDLAERFNGEIINADSWAVYKYFDIGTAKPSRADRDKIRHYLIDVADPVKGFSAAEFKKRALKATEEIYSRSKVPILVGGTGLYIDSLIYDYSFLPASSKNDRVYYDSLSLEELLGICRDSGYDIGSIDTRNKRRVIRLIENKGLKPSSQPIREDTLLVGLKINPTELDKRIQNRTNSMISNGLVEEVEFLAHKYGWNIEPMKGIGYREFKDYFEGEIDLYKLINRINIDTVKLVKKQRTWFKRNKSIQWCNNSDEIVDLVTTFMNKFK